MSKHYSRRKNYNNILTTTIDRKEELNHNLKNRLIVHISEVFPLSHCSLSNLTAVCLIFVPYIVMILAIPISEHKPVRTLNWPKQKHELQPKYENALHKTLGYIFPDFPQSSILTLMACKLANPTMVVI